MGDEINLAPDGVTEDIYQVFIDIFSRKDKPGDDPGYRYALIENDIRSTIILHNILEEGNINSLGAAQLNYNLRVGENSSIKGFIAYINSKFLMSGMCAIELKPFLQSLSMPENEIDQYYNEILDHLNSEEEE